MTITIADGRGALWQWDTGRRLRVGSGVEQVHYQNRALGCSVDVDVGTDGTAIIPDELLQDCHTLTAYTYITDDTGAYTMVQQDFIVHKRAKPAGYVYTPTDQMTLQMIQRQIGDLGDLQTTAKDNLVAAINEVALAGGAGSMDLRVADGYIQYSTDDGLTWQSLIAVADLKGDPGPKGDPGAPGAPGKDGITPTIGANGNWYLGSTDTGKPSRGAKGDKGETGAPGKDGAGAEVFYIDLGGKYPDYTCPVAMADIKAAYNAGKVLECRCKMGVYTATLPLFVPMPDAGVWIFSGSGALEAMSFPAQAFTIAISEVRVLASNTRLATMTDTLPNPEGLIITSGGRRVFYDGSTEENIDIPAGKTPVRGTDYWTEADKTAIVADVLAALPKYGGESE